MPSNKYFMTSQDNLYEWLMLTLTKGIGTYTAIKLVKHFGSVEKVINANFNELNQFINNVTARLLIDKAAKNEVNEVLDWVNSNENNYLISIDNPIYPKELAQIPIPPPVLYLKGNIKLINNEKLTIVGARYPTHYGINNATRFAKEISAKYFSVISTLSEGIDRYVHISALEEQNASIAVLNCGIEVNFSQTLTPELIKKGLLISEFGLKTPPQNFNLQRRNQLIAGLSKGVIIIESPIEGEALKIAYVALDFGREVMAIPGLIDNNLAKGCNKLIKLGAKLVENINDIIIEFNFDKKFIEESDNLLLSIIGLKPVSIDQICLKLDKSFSEVCAQLLELELEGYILNCGEGKYQRIFK